MTQRMVTTAHTHTVGDCLCSRGLQVVVPFGTVCLSQWCVGSVTVQSAAVCSTCCIHTRIKKARARLPRCQWLCRMCSIITKNSLECPACGFMEGMNPHGEGIGFMPGVRSASLHARHHSVRIGCLHVPSCLTHVKGGCQAFDTA